jgi:hypothetical protein
MLHLELMAWDNTKGRFLICICQMAFAAIRGEYLVMILSSVLLALTLSLLYILVYKVADA